MAILAEEVFRRTMTPEQREAAARRADELTAQYLTLQELRKARELTQTQLARVMGKNQVNIAQLEKRSDMLLSTLRSYIEAMGGQLNLVVEFPDREPLFLAGLGDDEPKPRPAGARARQDG